MEINFKDFIKAIKDAEQNGLKNIIDKYKEKYFEIELLNLEILDNCIYENESFYSFLNILGAKIINHTEKFVKIVANDGSIYIAEHKKCSNRNEVLIDFGTVKKVTRKNALYIITNRTESIEYTPTVVKTKKEAIEWLYECTAANIKSCYHEKNIPWEKMSNKEIIIWGQENISEFEISENKSYLPYSDESWQEMNIYEIEQPRQINWLKSVCNKNLSSEVRFYLNPEECKPGDIAYCYSDKTVKLLLIQKIISEKDNKEQYQTIINREDSIEDILSTGELFFNADLSADFVSNDGRILVWFKDISLKYKGDLFKE